MSEFVPRKVKAAPECYVQCKWVTALGLCRSEN